MSVSVSITHEPDSDMMEEVEKQINRLRFIGNGQLDESVVIHQLRYAIRECIQQAFNEGLQFSADHKELTGLWHSEKPSPLDTN